MPKAVLRHHYAMFVYALRLFVHKELDLFKAACGELRENIEQDKDLALAKKNQLLGEFELLQSFAEFNDVKKLRGDIEIPPTPSCFLIFSFQVHPSRCMTRLSGFAAISP